MYLFAFKITNMCFFSLCQTKFPSYIHPSTFFCPSTPCLCSFSQPHRLPADNTRGLSSGPAAGGAGRRG